MKELSIEEKTNDSNYKTYTELINRLEDVKDAIKKQNYGIAMDILCKSYPEFQVTTHFELKESEDERIRGNIIATIHLYYGEPLEDEAKEMIAWLERRSQTFNKKDIDDAYLKGLCDAKHEIEKQGERKPADKAVPFDEFEGLTDFERTLAVICIGWIGEELGWKQYIKDNADVLLKIAVKKFNSIQDVPFEQKPTWSEEDNKIIEEIINDIECARAINYHAPKEGYEFRENWLKSLRPQNWTKEDKERYISCLQKLSTGNPEQSETINSKWFKEHVYPQSQWKPSDEQMRVLDLAIRCGINRGTTEETTLVSLFNDLKILSYESKRNA